MPRVNVYLTFKGNCREVFDFYKSVFGGEYTYLSTFRDIPQDANYPPVKEENLDKIMHVTLPISSETILMGSDINDDNDSQYILGNNFAVSIDTDSREEADEIFQKLSIGGNVKFPMADVFWKSYFGALTDKYGINWYVNFNTK